VGLVAIATRGNVSPPSRSSSRVILAIDRVDRPLSWIKDLVENTLDAVAGYKLGLPFLVRYGLEGFKEIGELVDDKHLWIIDLKLADIGTVMAKAIAPLLGLGYNAFIAHSFVGFRDALDRLKEALEKHGAELILVVSMSHPGSAEVMDKSTGDILGVVKRAEPYGVVAPATRPGSIALWRKLLDRERISAYIFSPGIGAQGAKPGDAIRAGADYEIVGRMVTESENPRSVVEYINSVHAEISRG